MRDVAHAAGADPANTQRLVNILDAIGVTPVEASSWGSLERLARKSVCDAIEPILPLIQHGRIVGIELWLEFGAKKDDETLADMTAELREAARRANEDPNVTVFVGQDGVAKKQAEKDKTPQPPSFDMTVIGQDGAQEHVETKAIARDVKSGADLMSGVAHAAGKAHGSSVTGRKSATIEVTVPELIDQTKRKKGMITIDKSTGRRVRLSNEDPPREIDMKNLYDELAELLNANPRMDILDGVTIVDAETGKVLAKLERQTVWKKL